MFYHWKMVEKCGTKDTPEYINAQAFANDLVFEYRDDLPKNPGCIKIEVLLRERKRHTARRVLSTPSVVLPGYPPPSWPGWWGTLLGWVPCWGGTLPGYPPGRVPPLAGYPPDRVPPWQGTPMSHGILGNVAKHYGIWVPPCGQTDWWMKGQTRVKTLPSRRTTYAGGKNLNKFYMFSNE